MDNEKKYLPPSFKYGKEVHHNLADYESAIKRLTKKIEVVFPDYAMTGITGSQIHLKTKQGDEIRIPSPEIHKLYAKLIEAEALAKTVTVFLDDLDEKDATFNV